MNTDLKLPNNQFTQARFWKCALQVNPAAYINYQGQSQPLSETQYNQALLTACIESNISVIGLADHGNVDAVEAIRQLFSSSGIVVFPGFEISSSEKIHFVCLFSEETSTQLLERYLGNLDLLDPENGVRPSRLSAIQLIEKVEQLGGFIYAAHSTNDSGLLKAKMNHVWQHPQLKVSQIPGAIEDLKSVENDFYRKVFLNKDNAYKRERPMAAINAKDVEAPETIKKKSASCLIKMTKPSFSAFKQAFLDPESRVRLNSDVPENYASSIESIRFVSGYLDGVSINLSDHLNAIIGGRGTGKSTLLECIRFAMGIRPQGKQAQKQHDEIIKENVGKEKGLVELIVRSSTMNGRRFTVLRRYGEQTVVKNDQGELSPHTAQDLLPKLEMFGQNEIYEMTQNVEGKRYLLSRFLEGDHNEYETVIQEILGKLNGNRTDILRAYGHKNDIESEVEALPKLQDQVNQFQSLGIEEKLKVVPKLEKEKHLVTRVADEVSQLKIALETVADSLPDTAFLSEAAIGDLPHVELLRKQRSLLEKLKADGDVFLKQFEKAIVLAEQANQMVCDPLLEGIKTEELTLEKAFKNIPASQGRSGREIGMEYQKLLQKIERIKPKQITLKQRQDLIVELEVKRKLLLTNLSEAKANRSAQLQQAVKHLNKKLAGKLRLTIDVEGNREPLVQFLLDSRLDGVGEKRLAWVRDEDFSPANLSLTIRQGVDALSSQFWDAGIARTVINSLIKLPFERLLTLEEIELPDTIKMELNVAHDDEVENYRELERLSTGQQCTAILHLLLLDNQDPLILDQPEDNLDNAFIADRIVAELRTAKVARQFLFATHNANIPVFGDAEWIGVFNVVDGKGELPDNQQGAIDQPEIQKLAADILEGGKSAFNQRREKYGFE
ncbi:MAG: AAA family ATPase [Pseudomonadales bacterium]|nr:AAA family ATPase [Pseudomonadales bacterium]